MTARSKTYGRLQSVGLLIQVDSAANFERIGAAAAAEGVSIHRTLPRARALDARGPREAIAALGRIPGVESVREQRGVQLPPLDERVPQ